MAVPSKRMKSKRDREKSLQEKRKEKIAKRTLRKTERENNPLLPGGEDPDLAGIVPGPQPSQFEEDEENDQEGEGKESA